MNAYSKDLRLKVLSALERGVPRREVSEMLNISISTIYRYVKLKASGREIAPKPSPGRTSKILADPAHRGRSGASSKRTTPLPWRSAGRWS
jgi:transposase